MDVCRFVLIVAGSGREAVGIYESGNQFSRGRHRVVIVSSITRGQITRRIAPAVFVGSQEGNFAQSSPSWIQGLA